MKVTGTDGKEYTVEPDANLSKANLEGALYTDGTKFPEGFDPVDSGMHWVGLNANLEDADLRNVRLNGANLSKASLTDAYLEGAELSGANLYRAYLIRADLRGTNLSGADLSEADLTDANLSGAVWNDETVFPEGFEIPEKSET